MEGRRETFSPPTLVGASGKGKISLVQTLNRLLTLLPGTSLFRSGEPVFLLVVPLILSLLEASIVLQLALRSFGFLLIVKKTVRPGLLLGISVFLIRQLIPIPYHILPVILTTIVIVKSAARMTLARAIIATLFAESVVIVGSIFIAEPVLMAAHRTSGLLLATAKGFSLGTILETIIPAAVLAVFVKYHLCLGGLATSTENSDVRDEKHQV